MRTANPTAPKAMARINPLTRQWSFDVSRTAPPRRSFHPRSSRGDLEPLDPHALDPQQDSRIRSAHQMRYRLSGSSLAPLDHPTVGARDPGLFHVVTVRSACSAAIRRETHVLAPAVAEAEPFVVSFVVRGRAWSDPFPRISGGHRLACAPHPCCDWGHS